MAAISTWLAQHGIELLGWLAAVVFVIAATGKALGGDDEES